MDSQAQSDLSNISASNIWYGLGFGLGIGSTVFFVESIHRALDHLSNKEFPNNDIDVSTAAILRRRGYLSDGQYKQELLLQGYTPEKADAILGQTATFLGLADLVDLKYRKLIEIEEYHSRAEQLGFSKEQSDLALEQNIKLLSAGEVMEAFFRKVGGDNNLQPLLDNLRKQGYNDTHIDTLIQISKKIAGLQDLYNFAAWSVTDDNLAQQFNLDAEIPADYFENCFALGIDDKLARKMWRSHWQAPSPFILKELFQTGQVAEAQLKLLLKSYQIPPGFIDNLVKAFYKAPSDSQIIEMFNEGLITEPDIVSYVKRNGFNEQDAEKIAKTLVVKAQAQGSQSKVSKQKRAAELKGGNAGSIITAFKDGIIDEQTTRSMLDEVEPGSEFVDLQIATAKFEMNKQMISDEVNIVKDLYLSGSIDQTQAITYLSQIAITPERQTHLIAVWTKQLAKQNKRPSKADFDRFLKKGIISVDEYSSELQIEGYPDKYIQMFIQDLEISLPSAKSTATNAAPAETSQAQ